MTIRLLTTADELTQIAGLTTGRGRAKTDRRLLDRLVVDHTRALNTLRAAGIKIEAEA